MIGNQRGHMRKLSVSIIGTNGIPARYGGFETLAEYLGEHLAQDFEVHVFCSSNQESRMKFFKGCHLHYLPLAANGWQSIIYDSVSILISAIRFDRVLILGSSGAVILPFLFAFQHKFIFNFGGLDWRRSKWGPVAKVVLRVSEAIGVKFSRTVVADNEAIQKYILTRYGLDSVYIPYGGDQVLTSGVFSGNLSHARESLDLPDRYALLIARAQPDNNLDLIFEAFSKVNTDIKLVVISNFSSCGYGRSLKRKYCNSKRFLLLEAIYDLDLLNFIRRNCLVYFHGHSAGGTNPALVEAMFFDKPILCFDVPFNRETTNNKALYFSNREEFIGQCASILEGADSSRPVQNELRRVAESKFTWEKVCLAYAELLKK
jgi:glycosyltransferase involved in cell wall biosynthesis